MSSVTSVSRAIATSRGVACGSAPCSAEATIESKRRARGATQRASRARARPRPHARCGRRSPTRAARRRSRPPARPRPRCAATSAGSLTARSASTSPPAGTSSIRPARSPSRVAPHRDVRVVEAEPQVAPGQIRQRPDELVRPRLDGRIRHLRPGPLDVAEVGHEAPHVRADDGEAVGAGEAGQVAQVDGVGDEQGVELARRAARRRVPPGSQRRLEPDERVAVAVGALAATLAEHMSSSTDTCRNGSRCVDVGEVDLDRRQPGDLDRVAQRPRVVRPGARVQQQAVGVVARLVQLLDVLALVVGAGRSSSAGPARARTSRSAARAA